MAQDMVEDNPECCVYDDVHSLVDGHAICVRHHRDGGKCKVLGCHSFGSGFSCTAISHYNVHSPSARATLLTGGNPTADTWKSSLAYMRDHRPWLATFENLDTLDDKSTEVQDSFLVDDSNLRQARQMLTDIGYMSFVLEMRSLEFGVPQDRRRTYIGAIAMELYGYDVPKAVASTERMIDAIKQMKMPKPIDISSLTLPMDDDLVMLELQYWQGVKANRDESGNKDTAWQAKHQDTFQKHGLRWGNLEPHWKTAASPWFDTLTEREKDIVVFTENSAPDVLSIDVSQSIGRHRPQVHSDLALTCTPGEKRWDMTSRRLRVAQETFALQAIPWEDMDMSFDPPTLHSLAGNAWTGTVCMAFFMGMVVNLPLPRKAVPSSAGASSSSAHAGLEHNQHAKEVEQDFDGDLSAQLDDS